MKTLNRKGYSKLEITVVAMILAVLVNIFAMPEVINTQESIDKSGIFGTTVIQEEAQDAIKKIQDHQLLTGNLEFNETYISKYENNIEIETIECDNSNTGYFVSITQPEVEEVISFDTCQIVKNNKFNFEVLQDVEVAEIDFEAAIYGDNA